MSDDGVTALEAKLWRIADAVQARTSIDRLVIYDAMMRLTDGPRGDQWMAALARGDERELVTMFANGMPEVVRRMRELVSRKAEEIENRILYGDDANE